jgi:hypothetical protein
VSSFRDYGYEDSQDGTSMDEEASESESGTEVQQDEAQRAQALLEVGGQVAHAAT